MTKIGFLFGAGAEIAYGLPNGGKFALDIFRRDTSQAKEKFKENRDRILNYSQYASTWLPQDYNSKRVTTFRESVYENIIKDTVVNNRNDIVKRINNFDDVADSIVASFPNFKNIVQDELGREYQNINVSQQLKYNDYLQDGNLLFTSKIFSILLTYYKNFEFSNASDKELLGDIVKSILQLHIGAMSENLSRNLQENIFSTHELELDIFDDLGSNLSVNYQAAGVKGLELLSRKEPDDAHPIVKLAFKIIEEIYAGVLDYKSVIDSNWHYLYIPKHEWSKFCNISIFLHSVREYIESCNFNDQNAGYYDDLNSQDIFEIETIATSNYINNLIGAKLPGKDIIFLNGSIDEFYDPYMNTTISKEEFDSYERFAVPLIFTQSGTKPMTSIDMSIKYVDYYSKLSESDFICSIGFGFNTDDEHINGIIRTAIERDGKHLVVIGPRKYGSLESIVQKLANQLKVSRVENIHYVIVDNDRKVDSGTLWTEYIVSSDFLESIEEVSHD